MTAILDAGVAELVGRGITRKRACEVLGRARASHYRDCRAPLFGPPAPRPVSPRALSVEEGEAIVEVLNSERFCDKAPAQIWATLLDDSAWDPRRLYTLEVRMEHGISPVTEAVSA